MNTNHLLGAERVAFLQAEAEQRRQRNQLRTEKSRTQFQWPLWRWPRLTREQAV